MKDKKKKSLQYYITDFVIEIGMNVDKVKYNKAWHKLWVRISKLNLFDK